MLCPKQKAVLELIAEDPAYENYFFNKVSDIKWFYPLKEKGYFDPNIETQPKEDPEKKGFYYIPQWNVLPYLERVSKQVNVPGNEKYVEELLNIIRNVTQYHVEHGKILDNYRTWHYFVRILLNLPSDKIPIDVIEMIEIWLDSKFDNSLPGADVATKLLPKFLSSDNSEDWKKAEKIVEIITSIRWVKPPEKLRKGLFGKEEEPKTLLEIYWLKESLGEDIIKKIGERCSERIIFVLSDRLKEIFRKEYVSWAEFEFRNNYYRISVRPIDDDKYQVTVSIIKEENLISKKEEEKLLKSLEAESQDLHKFLLESCSNEERFVEGIKQELMKNKAFESLKDEIDEKLGQLYQQVFEDYSYTWFKSLYSKPTIFEAKEILTALLRDIVLVKAKRDDVTETLLKKFLGDKYRYPLFKRIVIFVIGNEWNAYKELFWELISSNPAELFDSPYYEREIYKLLQNNVKRFTREEKQKIQKIVETGPKLYLPDENQEKYVAYWKQKWYSALKADPEFADLYKKQKEISQIEEELEFKKSQVQKESVQPLLSVEEILRMSNEELVDYLKALETKKQTGELVEGLAISLRAAAQEKPEKFINELTPFLDIGYCYISRVLEGLRNAWNEKKIIEWGKLFKFIKLYIDRDDFWEDRLSTKGGIFSVDHSWVTGMIGDLIQDGTRKDSWAFSEEHFGAAKEVLFLILNKEKVEQRRDIERYISPAVSSPIGRVIIALIFLALRIARVESKKGLEKEIRWESDIKSHYEKLLSRGVLESFTLLGEYLPNIYYLDKKWTEEKVNSIKFDKNKIQWEAFMTGYLFGSKVYDDLYNLMRQHYLLALDYEFKEKDAEKLLVQHICIGYLRGNESIEDEESLFRKLIEKWDYSQIDEIIHFFWGQRENAEEIREKIISFWRWIYETKYRGKKEEELSIEERKILSDLSKLTVFLPKIDSENYNWLMLSAPYIYSHFNYSFFIEYLDKFEDEESIGYIGKIVVQMSRSAPFLSEYKQEHVRSIVEKLFKIGDKESAREICNTFAKKGYYFLRDICEKQGENRESS